MEQIACKECTSPDCHGCNLLRLEQMLKSGKFDALMDEKRGIKTGIYVRPVVRGRWIWRGFNIKCPFCEFEPQFDSTEPLYNFCPNCGARMDGESDV